jgi:hypothetical protein
MIARTGLLVAVAFFGLGLSAPASVETSPSLEQCRSRDNNAESKLLPCISEDDLWSHLKVFQRIANRNPGFSGHGNRDTGTSGYLESVDYVARLMRGAGYKVTIQSYVWRHFDIVRQPVFKVEGQNLAPSRDWFVARLSGSGALTALVQPLDARFGTERASGCSRADFTGFKRGHVALVARGNCDYDSQVANAQAAGAAAVIIYNNAPVSDQADRLSHSNVGAFEAHLVEPAKVPVIGIVSYGVGAALLREYGAGQSPSVRLDVQTRHRSDIDYNVIADSPFGDPRNVVVLEGHLDAIYGAGMLDNASGSTTMLEIALNMAQTHTRHQLRYIWFGGEEIGLLGSKYYTQNLTRQELHRIVFDIDADVTATPNFDILVAAAQNARNAKKFPPNVIPESRVGNRDFIDYFRSVGVTARNAGFGNDGTDSNSFSLVGVPNTGILTQQDCCKQPWEVKLWGGYLGDYEGAVPGWHQPCVDKPHRWCDNLSNNDPFVLELVSKAVAAVTLKLANDASLDREQRP